MASISLPGDRVAGLAQQVQSAEPLDENFGLQILFSDNTLHTDEVSDRVRMQPVPLEDSLTTNARLIEDLRALGDPVQQHRARLARHRGTFSGLRSKIDYELSNLSHEFRFTRESFEQLISAVGRDHAVLPSNHAEAVEKVEQDLSNLGHQLTIVMELHEALQKRELKMVRSEEKLFKATDEILSILPQTSVEQEDTRVAYATGSLASDESSRSGKDGSTKTHPLLTEYWDKTGDAKVMQARLDDLRFEYYKERTSRNFWQDQGEPFEVADEDFERLFKIRLQEAEQAVFEAEKVAQSAKAACLEQNLDISSHPRGADTELVSSQTLHRQPSPGPWSSPKLHENIHVLGAEAFDTGSQIGPKLSPHRSQHRPGLIGTRNESPTTAAVPLRSLTIPYTLRHDGADSRLPDDFGAFRSTLDIHNTDLRQDLRAYLGEDRVAFAYERPTSGVRACPVCQAALSANDFCGPPQAGRSRPRRNSDRSIRPP